MNEIQTPSQGIFRLANRQFVNRAMSATVGEGLDNEGLWTLPVVLGFPGPQFPSLSNADMQLPYPIG